jgi:hypothetical protein
VQGNYFEGTRQIGSVTSGKGMAAVNVVDTKEEEATVY